jgi:predicted metal-binding membrane protein
MMSMRGEGLLMDLAVAMMRPRETAPYLGATLLMWIVMMSAMMTPAVLPVVVLFTRLDRGSQVDPVLFATGYLLVWTTFAFIATVIQWALHRAALLHGHALFAGPTLAGVLLIGAGLYQLTPLKTACLAHCQSPVGFLMSHWREGPVGAFQMGMHHGWFCLGCCWVLMFLMFVYGVMSAGAMALLTLFVLAERFLPPGPWSAKLPGVMLIAWGAVTLAG